MPQKVVFYDVLDLNISFYGSTGEQTCSFTMHVIKGQSMFAKLFKKANATKFSINKSQIS